MVSDDKDGTFEETLSRTVSETPAESTVTEKKTVTTSRPSSISRELEVHSASAPEEESVAEKARLAGNSLKDLVYSLGRKTREVAEQKTQELKARSVDIGATSDARDIQRLGDNIEGLLKVFEDTMAAIRKEPYGEQEKLLIGYRKLLEEQINVVQARMDLARRLKPGS